MTPYRPPTLRSHAEVLRWTLQGHAIRLMGPHSPFWKCSYCHAMQTTPIQFKHEPACLLHPDHLNGEPANSAAEEALRTIATQSIYEWSETRSQLHDLIDAMREVASTALSANGTTPANHASNGDQ